MLDPRAPLQRAASIRLELDSVGRVRVRFPDGDDRVVPHGLEILEAFSTPASCADVLSALVLHGARDWVAARDAIRDLWIAGLLHEPGRPAQRPAGRGYEGTTVHAMMLNDRGRTAGFVRAVEAAVRQGDVVVDIGTGTGILALAAARAGARRVFAIESSSMADTAEAVFAANGFSDRITVLRGTSSAVTLPERADVVVAELLGHRPLDEGLLPVIADARRRHARPGARIIPRRLRVLAQPIEIPEEELSHREATPLAVARWQEWYGFDLSAVARRATLSTFAVLPEVARSWSPLAEAVTAFEIDLESAPVVPEAVRAEHAVAVERPGILNAVLIGMRAELGDGIVIETVPDRAAGDNCWKCPVWVLREPFPVEAGDAVIVAFSHGDPLRGGGEHADAWRPGSPAMARVEEGSPNAFSLSRDTRVLRAQGLLMAEFPDEYAVATPSGPALILEGSGVSIWKALEGSGSVAEVCAALAEEFDISPDECEADVIDFLGRLLDLGLIRAENGTGRARGSGPR